MSRPIERGERVGAMLSRRGRALNLFGYGTYLGEQPVGKQAAGWIAKVVRGHKTTNPTILLDDGQLVWGCECWWGTEAQVRRLVHRWVEGGGIVVRADLAAERAEATCG